MADSDSEKVTIITIEEAYPDGGLRAWLVVLGCFLYACTVLQVYAGWGLTWGLLQDYFHANMFPNTSLSVLSIISGLMSFTMCGSSYLFGGLGDRFCCLTIYVYSHQRSPPKIYHLFLFQGCLIGLAQGMGMPLYFSICSQWFLKKRGLATGIAVSGSGIGGGIETLLMSQLLTRIGYRNTLITFSSIHAFIWTIAWFLIKERVPPGTNPKPKKRWLPKKITGSFHSVALSMFLGVFGYLTPYFLITTFTQQMFPTLLQLDSLLATLPLIVMSFCRHLADAFGPTNMFFCSFFIGGILQMVFWSFARSYATIIAFSVLNGLIGSWFMSLLPVVCAKMFGVEGLATITGFMILANSPGQFAGVAIGAAILSSSGNNWTAVSLYSGSMQVAGALCILYGTLAN
ncbi:MFS general substrate transporter [Gymnopus androsaceus JB14]|uniref:MFS general substrate transporter n=1 Tax=Gymnopus androsaceus JB14 TaxID=1447944 RepID=A0A6A4I5Q4_9AGAR|nr:MFS general substrate transporter [Gymnopus androsaceus JB14]